MSGLPRATSYADYRARILSRVVITDDGCWEWQGALNRGGYGHMSVFGVRKTAHRASYEAFHESPVPEGLDLDHLCRRRRCVCPEHLEPVTRSENLKRGNVGGWNRHIEQCSQGHPFDETNTYNDPRGWRGCRTCRADAIRQYRERKQHA